MSLQASKTQLSALTRDLLNQWAHAKERWRDDKSREFEGRYLVALESEVAAALEDKKFAGTMDSASGLFTPAPPRFSTWV